MSTLVSILLAMVLNTLGGNIPEKVPDVSSNLEMKFFQRDNTQPCTYHYWECEQIFQNI